MVDAKERGLPNDAADHPAKYDTRIESLISNPAGPYMLDEAQKNAEELNMLQQEVRILRGKHYDDTPREELFESELQAEVDRATEFVTSDEGQEYVREGILRDFEQGEPKGRNSDDVYKETFTQRKKREYEEQERKKSE